MESTPLIIGGLAVAGGAGLYYISKHHKNKTSTGNTETSSTSEDDTRTGNITESGSHAINIIETAFPVCYSWKLESLGNLDSYKDLPALAARLALAMNVAVNAKEFEFAGGPGGQYHNLTALDVVTSFVKIYNLTGHRPCSTYKGKKALAKTLNLDVSSFAVRTGFWHASAAGDADNLFKVLEYQIIDARDLKTVLLRFVGYRIDPDGTKQFAAFVGDTTTPIASEDGTKLALFPLTADTTADVIVDPKSPAGGTIILKAGLLVLPCGQWAKP